jgi:Ca2+-binding EF-hand superfamily protein
MQRLDLDSDGSLSALDVTRALRQLGVPVSQGEGAALVCQFDVRRSGLLDLCALQGSYSL